MVTCCCLRATTRAVELYAWANPGVLEHWREAIPPLPEWIATQARSAPPQRSRTLTSSLTQSICSYSPVDPELISRKCQQMRAFRDGRGDLDYQRWWLGVGVLTHCRGGRELAHSWSAGTPSRYDGAKLDQFFDRWVESGRRAALRIVRRDRRLPGLRDPLRNDRRRPLATRAWRAFHRRCPKGKGEAPAARRFAPISPRALQSAWSSRIVRSYTKWKIYRGTM